jgi:hypothetical protein
MEPKEKNSQIYFFYIFDLIFFLEFFLLCFLKNTVYTIFRVFSVMRGKLRPYFIEQLPASVRTSLLEDTAAFLLHKSSVSGYCS